MHAEQDYTTDGHKGLLSSDGKFDTHRSCVVKKPQPHEVLVWVPDSNHTCRWPSES